MAKPASPPRSHELPPAPPDETAVVEEKRIRRLNWSMVAEATLGFFSLERGGWFTVRSFLLNPRRAFRAYAGAERLRFVNPLKIVVFLTAATAFLSYQLQVFQVINLGEGSMDSERAAAVGAFMQRNYNLLMLSTLPLTAVLSRLLYWSRVYNFLEHLALNAFQFSVATLAYLLLLPAMVLWPTTMMVYTLTALSYQVWVYRQVLGPSWLRAILATLLSTVVVTLSIAWMSATIVRLGWG